MKLSELKFIGTPAAKLHDLIRDKFLFDDEAAEQVQEFMVGDRDWEDLPQPVREILYSHYEKTMPYGTDEEHTTKPEKFILPALKKDFKL